MFVKNKATQINTIFGPGLESYFLSNIFVDKNKNKIKSPNHAGCEYMQNLQQMTKLLEAWNLEDLFLMILDFKLHLRIPQECSLPVNIYLHNVNNRNPSKRCNMLTKPTIKAAKRRHLLRSGVSLLLILNIVLTFFVAFLLLILKK